MSQLRSVLMRVEKGDMRVMRILNRLKQREIDANMARDELIGPGKEMERTLCCFLVVFGKESITNKSYLSPIMRELKENRITLDEAIRDIIELIIEDCPECPHRVLMGKTTP